jgi:hypothetical protein
VGFDPNIALKLSCVDHLLGRQTRAATQCGKNGARFFIPRPTGHSAASNRWSSWKSKQRNAPAFLARCAASNDFGVKNPSYFSTTWNSHDCAQWLEIQANLQVRAQSALGRWMENSKVQ